MATSAPSASELTGSVAPAAGPAILFTAFEPSGDAHAAPVIAAIRRRRPDLAVYAWGGPKMTRAGAHVIEQTGANAAMGANALAKVGEHLAINRRLRTWLANSAEGRRVRLHVPVDSPAANFPICKITRRAGCRIMHLVGPQMWAWGSWRVRKLRRLTDHVLCLLPFEPAFFEARGVRATFIGHPVLSRPIPRDSRDAARTTDLPRRHPRLALIPGSRPAEIDHVLPLMCRVLDTLQPRLSAAHHPTLVLPAASPSLLPRIEKALTAAGRAMVVPSDDAPTVGSTAARDEAADGALRVLVGRFDDALAWADVALTCSGTATLDITRAGVPMVVVYATDPLPWYLLGRWLLRAPNRALPNLVAGQRVIPEFIPHFGPVDAIAEQLHQLLMSVDVENGQLTPGSAAARQVDAQAAIRAQFAGTRPDEAAADLILNLLDASGRRDSTT